MQFYENVAAHTLQTVSQFLLWNSLAGGAVLLATLMAWLYAALRIRSVSAMIGAAGAILAVVAFLLPRLFPGFNDIQAAAPDPMRIIMLILLPALAGLMQAGALWGLVRSLPTRRPSDIADVG